MSWLLVNTVLAVQIFVVYLVSVNSRNLLSAIINTRQWMLPFGEGLMDIKEEMTYFLDGIRDETYHMLQNFRYIFVAAMVAVFANMMNPAIAWLPLWASVWWTVESVYHIYRINEFGMALNMNIQHAEQTVVEREYEEMETTVREKLADELKDPEENS